MSGSLAIMRRGIAPDGPLFGRAFLFVGASHTRRILRNERKRRVAFGAQPLARRRKWHRSIQAFVDKRNRRVGHLSGPRVEGRE
eukprot:2501416-Pleurochrysis_carterae.AAC.1